MSGPGLDLDALEDEEDPGPYPITFGGRDYETTGPMDMDYRDILQLVVDIQNGEIVKAIERIIREDDREAFWANKLPVFKMRALMTGYMGHYKLPSVPEAAASSPSSKGTAGPSKRTSRSAA